MGRMKEKIALSFSLFLVVLFLSSCFFSDKERALKVYKDSKNFIEVECSISQVSEDGEGNIILLLENIECLTPDKNPYKSYYCIIVPKNKDILNENDFIYSDENKSYRIIFCPCIMWDGGLCHILSISDEETVYLDYDSGIKNVLDWIKNDM